MLTNWIQQLRASTASLKAKLTDYFKNGQPPATPENDLHDLPLMDVIGLMLLAILLATLIK